MGSIPKRPSAHSCEPCLLALAATDGGDKKTYDWSLVMELRIMLEFQQVSGAADSMKQKVTLSKHEKRAVMQVELLVGIAMIALLLSVVMPSLKKAKEVVKAISYRSNLCQMTIASADLVVGNVRCISRM